MFRQSLLIPVPIVLDNDVNILPFVKYMFDVNKSTQQDNLLMNFLLHQNDINANLMLLADLFITSIEYIGSYAENNKHYLAHNDFDRHQNTSFHDDSDRHQNTSFHDDSDRHQNTSFHDDSDRHQKTSFHDDSNTNSILDLVIRRLSLFNIEVVVEEIKTNIYEFRKSGTYYAEIVKKPKEYFINGQTILSGQYHKIIYNDKVPISFNIFLNKFLFRTEKKTYLLYFDC